MDGNHNIVGLKVGATRDELFYEVRAAVQVIEATQGAVQVFGHDVLSVQARERYWSPGHLPLMQR